MNTSEIHAWNSRVVAYEHAQFLQSYEWGEFQRSFGREVVRLECVSALRLPLWRGATYLYCPRGPLGDDVSVCVKRIADPTRDIFVRFEPQVSAESTFIKKSVKTHSIQPDAEWILDTRPGYRVLLGAMHSKTRYNIGLANKKSVQVRIVANTEDLRKGDEDAFVSLLAESAGRGAFHLHPHSYYRALIRYFLQLKNVEQNNKHPFGRLYLAEHEGDICATMFVMFFGDTAYYLHGGTSLRKRELMVPYALHATAIAQTEALGYPFYNFGGIVSNSDPSHAWSGITKFKKGFGGELFLYPGTYDYPLHSGQYMVYRGGRVLWRLLKKVLVP